MTAQDGQALDDFAREISLWAVKKGFWGTGLDEYCSEGGKQASTTEEYTRLKKCEKAVLVLTEIAELVEALRKPHVPSELPGFTAEEEEVADAIIRLLDYAGHYGLRIGAAVLAKMAKNEGRPFLHGKAF